MSPCKIKLFVKGMYFCKCLKISVSSFSLLSIFYLYAVKWTEQKQLIFISFSLDKNGTKAIYKGLSIPPGKKASTNKGGNLVNNKLPNYFALKSDI